MTKNVVRLYISHALSFFVGMSMGWFIFKEFFMNAEKIEELAEKKALQKIAKFRENVRLSLKKMDSLVSMENQKLIFDYKRVITSDDVQTSKRVDEILDSIYSAHGAHHAK